MRGVDQCPRCGGRSTVLDTRKTKSGEMFLRRRRKCLEEGKCGVRWSTYEIPKPMIKQIERYRKIQLIMSGL